ncbi:MAG: mycothiol transferase [Galactobacter sp.]
MNGGGSHHDDLWAFPDESPEEVFRWSRTVAEHMDRLIEETPLDARGFVSWWGPGGQGREASLGELLVHMLNELARHLGHVDILRELTDGEVGYREDASNIPEHRTPEQWSERLAKLTSVAEATKPRGDAR